MSLEDYSKKRNFNKTIEPKGNVKDKNNKKLIFVVHEHWAKNHHFDLRIEQEGVLKSWAIPKNIEEAKKRRILAVQVEDHPYDYKNFSGTIPEGQYGCFAHQARIITNNGIMPISQIVRQKLPCKVLSFNKENKKFEFKKITNYFRNPFTSDLLKIRIDNKFVCYPSIFTCTPNHEIYTPDGKILAKNLIVGDFLLQRDRELKSIQIEFLLGTLLGDGCLLKSNRKRRDGKRRIGGSPYFSVVHSIKQIEYLNFKKKILSNFVDRNIRFNSPTSFGKTYKLETIQHPELEKVYNICYKNHKKTITWEWLNGLTAFGLAVLIMDDGCYDKRRRYHIATNSYKKEEVIMLRDILKEKWNIESRVNKSRVGFIINIYPKNAEKLKKLIAPYIIPVLSYKVGNIKCGWKLREILRLVPKEKFELCKKRIVDITKIKRSSGKNYDLEIQDNHNYLVWNTLVSNSGTVKIWDKGTYELLEKTDKKIIIKINGKKLKGTYVLVKFKPPNNWLFFKKKRAETERETVKTTEKKE